jgi:hypothetical protein
MNAVVGSELRVGAINGEAVAGMRSGGTIGAERSGGAERRDHGCFVADNLLERLRGRGVLRRVSAPNRRARPRQTPREAQTNTGVSSCHDRSAPGGGRGLALPI